MELSRPKLGKLLISQEALAELQKQAKKICSEKISYISPKEFSSYFVMAAD